MYELVVKAAHALRLCLDVVRTGMNFFYKSHVGIEPILLSFGVALFPLYIFPSGGVQPAHLLLAIFSLLVFSARGLPKSNWVLVLLALSLYVFGVELYYVLQGGSPKQLINAVYFSYNLALAGAVFLFCRRFGLGPLAIGVFVAAFVVLGLSVAYSSSGLGGGRFAAAFNNPNQLGFFSVVLVSLAYLFYRTGVIVYFFHASLVMMSVLFSMLSLSKAAIIPVLIVSLLVLKPESSGRGARLGWGAGVLIAVGILVSFYLQGLLDDYRVVSRIAGMLDENDTSLEARGYLAFLDATGFQVIFGMGAENAREALGREVHSTLASVLIYYGGIGFLLFFGALAIWARKLWSRFGGIGLFCIAGPAMLYGLTHNGTRFSIFWILFGASLAMVHLELRRSIDGED